MVKALFALSLVKVAKFNIAPSLIVALIIPVVISSIVFNSDAVIVLLTVAFTSVAVTTVVELITVDISTFVPVISLRETAVSTFTDVFPSSAIRSDATAVASVRVTLKACVAPEEVNVFNDVISPLLIVAVMIPVVFISIAICCATDAVPEFTVTFTLALVSIPSDSITVLMSVAVPVIMSTFVSVSIATDVFASKALRSAADALAPVTVNVNASFASAFAFVKSIFNCAAVFSVTVAVKTPSITPDTLFTSLASNERSLSVTFPAPLIFVTISLLNVVVSVTPESTTIFELSKSPLNVELAINCIVSFAGVVRAKRVVKSVLLSALTWIVALPAPDTILLGNICASLKVNIPLFTSNDSIAPRFLVLKSTVPSTLNKISFVLPTACVILTKSWWLESVVAFTMILPLPSVFNSISFSSSWVASISIVCPSLAKIILKFLSVTEDMSPTESPNWSEFEPPPPSIVSIPLISSKSAISLPVPKIRFSKLVKTSSLLWLNVSSWSVIVAPSTIALIFWTDVL